MGPVISEAALQRIQSMVEGGVASGGRLVCGGERLGGDHASGYFLPITVLADVAQDSEIARKEVFGPVLVVTPFDSEEEAVAMANDTDYGLGAYIHTTNLARDHRVPGQMMAGTVQETGRASWRERVCPYV